MKVLVGVVFLVGISLVAAKKDSYFSHSMKWMEDLDKNGDETLRNLASIDFHLSKEMLVNATERAIEYMDLHGYNTDINSTHCLWQFVAWLQGMQNAELWALSVFDATAKLNSGFARGNFRNPGHFRQCINIKQQLPDERQGIAYQGKMCLIPLVSGFHDIPNVIPPEDGAAFPM